MHRYQHYVGIQSDGGHWELVPYGLIHFDSEVCDPEHALYEWWFWTRYDYYASQSEDWQHIRKQLVSAVTKYLSGIEPIQVCGTNSEFEIISDWLQHGPRATLSGDGTYALQDGTHRILKTFNCPFQLSDVREIGFDTNLMTFDGRFWRLSDEVVTDSDVVPLFVLNC